jgi:phage shock protein A
MTTNQTSERDVISRLAARGDEALQRLSGLPGGTLALKTFNDLRARVDELGRRVRGIEELEARVASLEKEVASLKRARKTPAS